MNAPVYYLPIETTWTQSDTVFGLGDPLDDALIGNRSQKDWSIASEPASSEITGPCFLVARDLWVSPHLWTHFKIATQQQKSLTQLACSPSGPGGLTDPLSRIPRDPQGRLRHQLYFVPDNVTISLNDTDALSSAKGIEVTGLIRQLRIPVDPHMGHDGHVELQWSDTICSPIGHWSELLRTNLLAIGSISLSQPPMKRLLRYLFAVCRSLSLNMDRVRKHLNTVGHNCRIHPSATVEGCRLGDNVEIGPGAVLRGCFIGDHARIESQAICDLSVIASTSNLDIRKSLLQKVFKLIKTDT